MASLRFLVWLLLTPPPFGGALFAFALSRSMPALDYGWVNGILLLAVWGGIVSGLRRSLFDDWSARGGSSPASGRIATTTLNYRRR